MSGLPQRLVLVAPHQFAWETIDLRPLKVDEVGVQTSVSAISVSSELGVVDGQTEFPTHLGYQTLGVVESVGPEVTLRIGQRVVSTLGHAAYGIHKASRLIPVPDHVSDHVALCVILGEETHKGIRKVAPVPSDVVLVVGAGLLGLLSVFNLTRRGVQHVIVLEPDPARRRLAEAFGARAYGPGELPPQ